MKTRILLAAAGAAMLAPAANAQTQSQQGGFLGQILGSVFGNQQASDATLEQDWNRGGRPFADRRANLEARIDAAVRNGSLNRYEADQMRREYDDIVRLEAQYAANGSYSPQQRQELRARYRALVQRVGGQGYGQPNYGQPGYGQYQPVAGRNAEFEARVNEAVRDRRLSLADAARLRADWRVLTNLEASYGRNGLDSREQADLQARFDLIDRRLGGALGGSSGGQYGGQYGGYTGAASWRELETRLSDAERAGRVSRIEVSHVRAQIGDLQRLDAAYAANGYRNDERTYLAQRYQQIEQLLGYRR